MGRFSVDNKKFSIIFLTTLAVIAAVCVVSLWPSSDTSKPVAKKQSPTESTLSTDTKITTTSSANSTSTTTTAPKITTTSPKTKASEESTTTTLPFAATASANLASESYDQCVAKTYVFSGSVSANKAGTATWYWVKNGSLTGESGSITFDNEGNTSDSIPNYTLNLNPFTSTSGWVALKITWSGGNHTSSHVDYTFTYPIPPSGFSELGC